MFLNRDMIARRRWRYDNLYVRHLLVAVETRDCERERERLPASPNSLYGDVPAF